MDRIPVPFRFAIVATLVLTLAASWRGFESFIFFVAGVLVGLKFLAAYAIYRSDRERERRERRRAKKIKVQPKKAKTG